MLQEKGRSLPVCRFHHQALMEKMTKKKVKHSKYAMVWRCFSWGGVGSLVLIRDKLTALKYVDIVNDHIISSATEMAIQ